MRYKLLGKSGLRVCELCLGTMTFGEEWGWGASQDVARKIFESYVEAGGNFIDTANGYTNGRRGRSSPILGARTFEQWTDNLKSLDISLSEKDLNKLNEVSEIDLGFPHDFLQLVNDRLHGGTYDKIDQDYAGVVRSSQPWHPIGF